MTQPSESTGAYFHQPQRMSSPVNNLKLQQIFKPNVSDSNTTTSQQRDHRYNESLFNRIRFMPNSTQGTHQMGHLYMQGGPGAGQKLAKSTHDRPSQLIPYAAGREAINMPFAQDFLYSFSSKGTV